VVVCNGGRTAGWLERWSKGLAEFWPELEVGGGEEAAGMLVGELLTGAFIEEADRVMFGILEASLVASSEFDTDRNCLGAGTGFAASFGFGGMFTGFVIRISWAIELGRNGWGETKARFWIPLKLLALSFTLMITSLAGSFSFSHSVSFSFSN